MLVAGLTGSSGAGKGVVASLFLKYGVKSIDTDLVYREITYPASPCLNELVSAFSPSILLPDGNLDRRKLASIVFSDKDKLDVLNGIAHRHILAETEKRLAALEKAGCRIALVDAPVLFESGFDKKCDVVVCVVAKRDARLRRIVERDGITRKAAEERLRNMQKNSFYTQKSDFVIKNDGSLDELEERVKETFSALDSLAESKAARGKLK